MMCGVSDMKRQKMWKRIVIGIWYVCRYDDDDVRWGDVKRMKGGVDVCVSA